MIDPELKKTLDELHSAVHSMQKKNDERLEALEKKGSADGLINEEVTKTNKAISDLQNQIKSLTTRPALETKGFDGNPMTKEAVEQKAAFINFMRKGAETLGELEKKALVSSDDPNGGFFLPRDMSGRVVRKVFESSVIRQLASVQTVTGESLEGMYDDDEVTVGKVGEQEARNETTTTKVGMWKIPVTEGYAKPRASQRILDDAAFDLESWLSGKVAEKFARVQENEFCVGDGVTQARGLTTYTPVYTGSGSRGTPGNGKIRAVKTGTAGDLPDGAGDKLLNMIMALKGQYRRNGKWLLGREGIEKARLVKMDGKYIWTAQNVSVDAGSPTGFNAGTLHGYPVFECNDLPAFANGSVSMVFGDIAELYQIVDRQGIRVIRDIYSAKPMVEFYSTARWGGDVINFEAAIYGVASA